MINVTELLKSLDFEVVSNGFKFNFGNCELTAVESMNNIFQETIFFSGTFIETRSCAYVEFSLPLQVNSFEEGLACLAYHLRNYNFNYKPLWLHQGLEWKDHIPCVKKANEIGKRRVANIDAEWFKIIVKRIRNIAENTSVDDVTIFSFDKNVFKVVCNDEIMICTGIGKSWGASYIIKTKKLTFLPKRIKNQATQIYSWNGYLNISNRLFEYENVINDE